MAKTSTSTKRTVRIGPAGWSYDDWKGIVYPAGQKQHPLELLAQYFDTVEVNSTFYHPPQAKYCASWVEKVRPFPNFKFTAKLWERYTHKRGAWPSDAEAALVMEGFEPLQESGLLGAVLVQFPWSFKRTDQNRRWLANIIETFCEYPLTVEMRHASWDRSEVYTGFRDRGISFCNIDQPIFNHSIQPSEHVTASIGYVRLHGRNHDDWFREEAGRDDRYNYLYSEDELKPWIAKVESIRNQVDEVYVITNNHYRGQAVVNALEIAHSLSGARYTLPNDLVSEYPRLRRLMK